MKKILLFFSCTFLLGSLFINQSQAQSTVWGIRGGLNFSNLNDSDFDVDSRTAFSGGLFLNVQIKNSPVSIQPEVLYTQKGFEEDDDSYHFDYVQIPVLARFNFTNERKLLPFVYLGPYIAVKVNADTPPIVVFNDFIEGPTIQPVQGAFSEGDINPIDFGATVGGGLDLGRIDVGIRYDAGFTKVSDDENVTAKNGVISIMAGIGF